MARKPKRRAYDSSSRQEGARATRRAILVAARKLFLQQGYAATTMPDIARAAEVALDTVYAAVGKKPALFRLLVETAISGEDEVVTPEERDYVQAIRAEPDAANKLRIYAATLCRIHPRLAPLVTALQGAASLDSDLKALWGEISERRRDEHAAFCRKPRARGLAARGSVDFGGGRHHLEPRLARILCVAGGKPRLAARRVRAMAWECVD